MKWFSAIVCSLVISSVNSEDVYTYWGASDVIAVTRAMSTLETFILGDFPDTMARVQTSLDLYAAYLENTSYKSSMIYDLLSAQLSYIRNDLSNINGAVNSLGGIVYDILTVNETMAGSLSSISANVLTLTSALNGLAQSPALNFDFNLAFQKVLDALQELRTGLSVTFPDVIDVNVVGGSSIGGSGESADKILELIRPTYEFLKDFAYREEVSFDEWVTDLDIPSPFDVSQIRNVAKNIQSTQNGDFITPILQYLHNQLHLSQQQFIALQRLCSYLSPTNSPDTSEAQSFVDSNASATLDNRAEDYINGDSIQSVWSPIKNPILPNLSNGNIPARLNFAVNLPKPFQTQGIVIETANISEILDAVHYAFKAIYFLSIAMLIYAGVRLNIWIWKIMISFVGKFTAMNEL